LTAADMVAESFWCNVLSGTLTF